MGRISKTFALFLTLIIAISCLTLLVAKPANAQTEISVPRFTIEFRNDSLQLNATEFIKNQTIQIKIQNQLIANSEKLLYLIDFKSHFVDDWNSTKVGVWQDQQSKYTVIVYAFKSNNASNTFNGFLEFSIGDTIDFRVQAELLYDFGPPNGHIQSGFLQEIGRSEWSTTQTVTIGETALTPPAPTQTVPEFSWLTILPILIATSIALVTVRKRLQRNVCKKCLVFIRLNRTRKDMYKAQTYGWCS
jgi:hypothetical protein